MSEFAQESCASVPAQNPPPNSSVLKGFSRREELAEQFNISTRTLDRWHALGIGPPRVCVGRTILYNNESVRDWLLSEEKSGIILRARTSPQVRLRRIPYEGKSTCASKQVLQQSIGLRLSPASQFENKNGVNSRELRRPR